MSNNVGRPTDYRPEYVRMAARACQLGAIDKDLAEMFDVSEQTINAWKKAHPEFLEALKINKAFADERVERALYERAIGYSHAEDKIFNNNGEEMVVETTKHYPPDTGACVVWLANRQPDRWKKDPGEVRSGDAPPLTINYNVVDGRKDA